jgi:hypothetical protein
MNKFGLISFIVAQTIGAIWWAAKIDNKVEICSKYVKEIPKIRERIKAMLEEINQIEERVYGR